MDWMIGMTLGAAAVGAGLLVRHAQRDAAPSSASPAAPQETALTAPTAVGHVAHVRPVAADPIVIGTRRVSTPPTPPRVAPPAPALADKPDWQLYEAWVREHGVRCLYHFTDAANLASIIANGGLYSWAHCDAQGLPIACPGGDHLSRRLDEHAGLEDYVRLSFTDEHPMKHFALSKGRIQRPVVLRVDPRALWLAGTKYCAVNATRKGARVGGTPSHLAEVRFDLCRPGVKYFDLDESVKPYFQAEVLVPTHVPAALIMNLPDLEARFGGAGRAS